MRGPRWLWPGRGVCRVTVWRGWVWWRRWPHRRDSREQRAQTRKGEVSRGGATGGEPEGAGSSTGALSLFANKAKVSETGATVERVCVQPQTKTASQTR